MKNLNLAKYLLIDDILTSGNSFIQIKRKLTELGAKSIIGIFLGKTISK
ncbi:phosphoribosyltransferase [Dysgonomonas macrotermitis]|uniref:Phosphoribosyl transferase domain-containing protein n=1 Tax=Dysgonomonas macrotermitis TaxID=1346286 RepID=A0A1M5J6Z0_9BACT|nr:hypothetical protein SAMN05444362_12219 [Dysgonomonas macrotermitis]